MFDYSKITIFQCDTWCPTHRNLVFPKNSKFSIWIFKTCFKPGSWKYHVVCWSSMSSFWYSLQYWYTLNIQWVLFKSTVWHRMSHLPKISNYMPIGKSSTQMFDTFTNMLVTWNFIWVYSLLMQHIIYHLQFTGLFYHKNWSILAQNNVDGHYSLHKRCDLLKHISINHYVIKVSSIQVAIYLSTTLPIS